MLKQNARYKARVNAPRASSSNYNTHTVISDITALLNSNAIRGSPRENFVACCWEYCFVKNSCEFADFIGDKTLNACEELVSFDVVSLFTKIPVDLAVKVAEERLREEASLGQRTSLLF